jgi:hypothetical protein
MKCKIREPRQDEQVIKRERNNKQKCFIIFIFLLKKMPSSQGHFRISDKRKV